MVEGELMMGVMRVRDEGESLISTILGWAMHALNGEIR